MSVPIPPDVEAVIAAVRERLPDACVVLTGSVGSGELTFSDSGERMSDVELGLPGGPRAFLCARRVRAAHPEVEIAWVAPWRMRMGLRRNLSGRYPNVPAFDLARAPMCGTLPRSCAPPKYWRADELGSWEATVLLLNRVSESVVVGCTPYAATKVAVACGDAVLIARGEYASGYRARSDRFRELAGSVPNELMELIAAGYEQKLSGRGVGMAWEDLRGLVAATLGHLSGSDAGTWRSGSWPAVREELVRLRSEGGAGAGSVVAGTMKMAECVLRGARRVGGVRAIRSAFGLEPVETAVYAAMLVTWMACRFETGVEWRVPGSVPSALAADRDGLVTMWYAFCY